MILLQKQLVAWLAMLALVVGPITGFCTMPASAASMADRAHAVDHGEKSMCCCEDQECTSEQAPEPQKQTPSDCLQAQSLKNHLLPAPRISLVHDTLPAPPMLVTLSALQPESLRQAQLSWPVTYAPWSRPEAESSLLAQGCALNT